MRLLLAVFPSSDTEKPGFDFFLSADVDPKKGSKMYHWKGC
jgi:hypothetical protein